MGKSDHSNSPKSDHSDHSEHSDKDKKKKWKHSKYTSMLLSASSNGGLRTLPVQTLKNIITANKTL